MKMMGILKLLSLFTIIAMLAGCNMFKSFDKPTDEEDAKFKAKEALKKAYQTNDFASAITSLESVRSTLTPGSEEYIDVTQQLATAQLGEAGVNAFDIGIALTTTTDSANDNSSLIKTLDGVNFEAVEKAAALYNDLLLDELSLELNPTATTSAIKRVSTSPKAYRSHSKEIYASAAICFAISAANDLATVIYNSNYISVNFDSVTLKYQIVDKSGSKLSIRTESDLKNKWLSPVGESSFVGVITKGDNIIMKIEASIYCFKKTLNNSTDSEIIKSIDKFLVKLQKYKGIKTISDFNNSPDFYNDLKEFSIE